MSILSINNLTHTFDGKVLFSNANLTINNGEHIGVVGLNGAGKSTFMNIITGRLLQDDGEVKFSGNIRKGYLDQHAEIDKNLTIMQYLKKPFQELFDKYARMEELYTQMCELQGGELERAISITSSIMDELNAHDFFDIENQIKKTANGLGVGALGYDTLIKNLSGGQRVKVMLANLLLTSHDILLLDEPTNFLDTVHITWLVEYLNSFEGAVLVISHDTEFLNQVSRFIISVENASIKKYTGNYDKFISASTANLEQTAQAYARQQQQIKKLETFISKNKARAATANMAKSRERVLEKMQIIDKPSVVHPATFNFPYIDIHSKDMLVIKNLEIGYNNKALLPPFSLHMSSGDKIWIRGTNGIGKSTLLKTLMRKIAKISGSFDFSINAKLLYLEQDSEFSNSNMTAVEYMQENHRQLNSKDIRTVLGTSGIKGDLAIKPIEKMSGGEQVKVRLASLTRTASNFLILDEPTNHLDVLSKESLKGAIEKFEGCVILVSHEREFAENVCNDIIDLV